MCGIFAYLNFFTPKKRAEVIEILLQGLRRMEYRGYDSAGIAIDCSNDSAQPHGDVAVFRKTGKVDMLDEHIQANKTLDMDLTYTVHCGIGHTRWATHGKPKDENAHPQRSNYDNDFVVVHNGILTNYKEIKGYLQRKGHQFESETDTEVIAKLIQHVFDRHPSYSFRQLVEMTIQQLEGAFALAFKSRHFPGQLVATRRGSPLLVGIKSESRLSTEHFPIYYSKARHFPSSIRAGATPGSTSAAALFLNFDETVLDESATATVQTPPPGGPPNTPSLVNAIAATDTSLRSVNGSAAAGAAPACDDLFSAEALLTSTTIKPGRNGSQGAVSIRPFDGTSWEVEYFVASDASAIIEHTRQVIFLEDDDVALVEEGALSIHRIKRDGDGPQTEQTREVQRLTMELQQIMRGDFRTFMQKEIYEQPESVVNTMRGRVHEDGRIVLGGIKEYMNDIRRCRRLIMIACGTSYNSTVACRQLMEELTELPVVVELASDFLDRVTPIFRDDVCFFISQSGETADTLMALRYCKPRGALLIGITNTVGSSICRETHCGVHINAGPEIGVASTKAYTSQILALVMFALSMCDDRISLQRRRMDIIQGLVTISERIKRVLEELNDQVLAIARQIYREKSVLVMGRGYNFATCLEGALKIKELSYMHCEGILSGELKHGPLAMVDESKCIVMIISKDHVYKRSLNAMQQVMARGGRPIVIADETVPMSDLTEVQSVLRVPKTVDCLQNILTVIPLQLLAFHVADLNGFNVDRPRNLAKSVTVE